MRNVYESLVEITREYVYIHKYVLQKYSVRMLKNGGLLWTWQKNVVS